MREATFSRWLPIILMIGFFFYGCLGRSQSPRFYTLSPVTENKTMAQSDTPARDDTGIVSITLRSLAFNLKGCFLALKTLP